MKPRPSKTLFPSILLALVASCASERARKDVLLPAMRSTWPAIRADVEKGTQDPVILGEAQDMSDALGTGDPAAVILIPWPPLDAAARHGVDVRLQNHEIGVNGASLMIDRITQFGEAYGRLQR